MRSAARLYAGSYLPCSFVCFRFENGVAPTSISLTLLDVGGVTALLLWGVHMVQTGVQRALGAKLRSLLAHHLGDRFRAFVAGLGVTALLQSSTATGLMVTGFAAEGLVGLVQGLAAMLGANVGTTLIVQLMSFDVARIAPILILAGYLLFRRAEAGWRDSGRVFIGLGLILFALHEFLALLGLIAAAPMARSFLTMLSGHIVFLVVLGAIMTWAAHSSVAVVLLAISFTTEGVLPLPAGIALALGANLGSAINPVLEGAARDPAARRLPLGNLINRLTGVALVLALFPLIPGLVAGLESEPARAIANFHTGLNAALALLFLPLLGPFARLLERLLPARPDEGAPDAPRYLEPVGQGHAPARALGGATREALRLAEILEQMLLGLRQALARPDRRYIAETRALDDRLDHLNRAIKENLLAIDPACLDEEGSRTLARVLTFSINLEQAGDVIDRGLLGIASRQLRRGVAFSAEGTADLISQVDGLLDTLRSSTTVFLSGDARAARELASEKQALRRIDEQATAAHFERLRSGNVETVETSALHLDALRDLKRVGSHLIEASAYPILKQNGDLLPTRLRTIAE
jgi:phosphate:Na+ symporter